MGFNFRKIVLVLFVALSGVFANAQTNVFDNIIATSPDYTILKTALQQEGLDIVLKDSTASYTIFAPTNNAFDSLASDLGVRFFKTSFFVF